MAVRSDGAQKRGCFREKLCAFDHPVRRHDLYCCDNCGESRPDPGLFHSGCHCLGRRRYFTGAAGRAFKFCGRCNHFAFKTVSGRRLHHCAGSTGGGDGQKNRNVLYHGDQYRQSGDYGAECVSDQQYGDKCDGHGPAEAGS